jgi:hypothetical protein
MRAPLATELLDLWDAGGALTPMERSVLLLRAACGGDPEIERWTLGEVNARLLELRALLFGRRLECLANCPRCDAVASTEIDVRELLSAASSAANSEPAAELATGNTRIGVRLPTAGDLIALGRSPDASGSALVASLVDGLRLDVGGDSDRAAAIAGEVARHVTREDPLAHIELVVCCPACANRWSAPFYAIDILWTEITALAELLIHEVARLAQAFGWREADILQLSAQRRQHYLEALT